jgi:predicted Zn-dependent peptidase
MQMRIKTILWITTIFADIPWSTSTTVEIMVKAWNVYEQRDTNWLSHFLEHMFFKWGKRYSTPQAVAWAIDAFGGECNAYTSTDYAGYYVKSAPEFLYNSLEILADMLVDAQFPKEEMEREKGVIIQEIKMYEDNPQRNIWSKRSRRWYGDNPYGRSILWPEENIKSFTQDHLFAHKNSLYTKDNLVIVIAGRLDDPKLLEERIGELFGSLPTRKTRENPVLHHLLPNNHQEIYTKQTQQNHLLISASWFSLHQDERYAANLLSQILWGNMSSRLFQRIREQQGLCYYIAAMHSENDADGTFFIKAGMEKARREQWLASIYEQLDLLASGDLTSEEHAHALGHLAGKTQMGLETSDQVASYLGTQWLFTKNITTLEEELQKYQQVTHAQLQSVAKKLTRENLYAYWIE